jgi:hypothetical protein
VENMEEKVEGGNSDSSKNICPVLEICISVNGFLWELLFAQKSLVMGKTLFLLPKYRYVDDNGKVNMEEINRNICEE